MQVVGQTNDEKSKEGLGRLVATWYGGRSKSPDKEDDSTYEQREMKG